MFYRAQECILWGPLHFIYSVPYPVNWMAKKYTKLGKTSSLASDCVNFVASFVPLPFLNRSPATIAWLIVSVIIYSIYFKIVGTLAHILQKILELKPSTAHRYASFPVIFVSSCLWVIAPVCHVSPRCICATFISDRSVAVLCSSCSGGFYPQASTRFYLPAFYIPIRDSFYDSTSAKTFRDSFFVSRLVSSRDSIANHFKSSKSLTDEGYSCRHNFDDTIVVFSDGCPATTGTCYDYGITPT